MGKPTSNRAAPKSRPTPSRREQVRARADQARKGRNEWITVAVVAAVVVVAVTALLVAVLPPLEGVPLRRHF